MVPEIKFSKEKKLVVLRRSLDRASNNLFIYSANYAMSKAKEHCEELWKKAKEEVEVLEHLIKEIEGDVSV